MRFSCQNVDGDDIFPNFLMRKDLKKLQNLSQGDGDGDYDV